MIIKHETNRAVIACVNTNGLTRQQMEHFFLTVKGWAFIVPEVGDLMASYVVQNLIKEGGDGPRMDLAGGAIVKTEDIIGIYQKNDSEIAAKQSL